MVKCIFQCYLRFTSIATYMSKVSIAVSMAFQFHNHHLPWPGGDGETKQWQRPTLVIKFLGQTRGMRACNRFLCAAVLSSSFLCLCLEAFSRRHMSKCLFPDQSDVAMLEENAIALRARGDKHGRSLHFGHLIC